MNIQYLNSDLRELNIKLRAAFEKAQGLSEEDVTQCRWVAMGMRPATTEV